MEKKFYETYEKLSECVKDLKFEFKELFLRGSIYFVSPRDILYWALINDYVLTEEVQNCIDTYQDISTDELPLKTRNVLPMQIREKVAAQLYLAINQNIKQEKLCERVISFINFYCTTNQIDLSGSQRRYLENLDKMPIENVDFTATRKNINPIYKSKKSLKPIEEIVKIGRNGQFHYNFPLFQEAMTVAAYFITTLLDVEKYQKKYSQTNITIEIEKHDFANEFFQIEILKNYGNTQNKYVQRIIEEAIDEGFLYFNRYHRWLEREASIKRHIEIHGNLEPEEWDDV